jgi:hypothetical protein
MNVALGITFLVLELVFIALVLLAIVRTGLARLGSAIGIARDGFPPGKMVPPWSLPDIDGHLRVTPAGDHWQLLVFVNRALVAFPELVEGMHRLAQATQDLEVLILSNEGKEHNSVTVEGLALQIAIVSVDAAFYDRFRVRVMPFAFFLDPRGIVRWVGLVSTENQLFHAWRMAQANVHVGTTSREV